MEKIKIKITKTSDCADLPVPRYMTSQASGMDIYAGVGKDIVVPVGKIVLVPTGLKVSIPKGFEIQIRPRSGLAIKHGITVLNSPGTIDSDYRGEIKIILINLGEKDFIIHRGDRIAQMVLAKTWKADISVTENLDDTERGESGFGHTGL
jgi:dUTP pyrophosphatase